MSIEATHCNGHLLWHRDIIDITGHIRGRNVQNGVIVRG